MFRSALFVVTMPPDRNEWARLRQELYSLLNAPNDAAERLGENVWMLHLAVSLTPLGQLIAGCERIGVAYRLLPFRDEPQWLPADQPQTPNLANR